MNERMVEGDSNSAFGTNRTEVEEGSLHRSDRESQTVLAVLPGQAIGNVDDDPGPWREVLRGHDYLGAALLCEARESMQSSGRSMGRQPLLGPEASRMKMASPRRYSARESEDPRVDHGETTVLDPPSEHPAGEAAPQSFIG